MEGKFYLAGPQPPLSCHQLEPLPPNHRHAATTLTESAQQLVTATNRHLQQFSSNCFR